MTTIDIPDAPGMAVNSCLGYHCDLRNKCDYYDKKATGWLRFFQPHHTGEHCEYFATKRNWLDEE